MWVIYHKQSQKIAGVTANTDLDIDKEAALTEIVGGLAKPSAADEYDAIQVKDRKEATKYMAAFPSKLVITRTTGKLQLVIRDPEAFSLHITTDASDKHPIDGIPGIPADGTSFATITVQKIDDRRKRQSAKTDNDQIYLRTNCGIIRNAEGTGNINAIQLSKGAAVFRLVSEKIKRVATVQVMSASPMLRHSRIRIEFI